jgi:hypothetical protein
LISAVGVPLTRVIFIGNKSYSLAKAIVTYRSMNGDLKIEDLSNIKDFPVDKLKIIALYLEF